MKTVFRIIMWCIAVPIKVVKQLIVAPYRVFRFMTKNAIFFGVISLVRFIFRGCFRIMTRPMVLASILGGSIVFVMMDEDRRKKAFEMVGL
ncbi:MAG: hypothetical protein U9P80_00540 [Thermodesulfobacteriota bacterium]|nr:hypothetical protein [Thermodesulfobacteriota bacterium]